MSPPSRSRRSRAGRPAPRRPPGCRPSGPDRAAAAARSMLPAACRADVPHRHLHHVVQALRSLHEDRRSPIRKPGMDFRSTNPALLGRRGVAASSPPRCSAERLLHAVPARVVAPGGHRFIGVDIPRAYGGGEGWYDFALVEDRSRRTPLLLYLSRPSRGSSPSRHRGEQRPVPGSPAWPAAPARWSAPYKQRLPRSSPSPPPPSTATVLHDQPGLRVDEAGGPAYRRAPPGAGTGAARPAHCSSCRPARRAWTSACYGAPAAASSDSPCVRRRAASALAPLVGAPRAEGLRAGARAEPGRSPGRAQWAWPGARDRAPVRQRRSSEPIGTHQGVANPLARRRSKPSSRR